MGFDPILLEIFKHMFAAIPEEMGIILRKSSYSPNIKERRDFSCGLFDVQGQMIAQAAHIPVHLGSMPLSVQAAIQHFSNDESGLKDVNHFENTTHHQHLFSPGDVIVLNDPFHGGTHLPDITLITPVFIDERHPSKPACLIGFAANRAHHADVGGSTPGSMGISQEIFQEGLIIPPLKLVAAGRINQGVWDLIMANVRTPVERAGDLQAQISANQRGVERLQDLVRRYGIAEIQTYMDELLVYSERMTRHLLAGLPDGIYRFTDHLDDDGIGGEAIPITVAVTIAGDSATIDFSGSAPQQKGGVNAVLAITLSAVYYVFRSLMDLDIPNNSGCLAPISVIAPRETIVNAIHPAPVAGGNVETAQRIVDVLLGALAQAFPGRIPAASQGTMNNLTIGGWDPTRQSQFTYYETIGGGMGARPMKPGPDAVHSHMTNTLNTPIEALEYAFPLRVMRYEIRRGSGGVGLFPGGAGIRRDVQVLVDSRLSLLTERRRFQPYGLDGGEPGQTGENMLLRGDKSIKLPGKGHFELIAGDIISIRTPGGGGYGDASKG